MARIKAKQIEKQLAGYVFFEQAAVTGDSADVTTSLTAAAATAGDDGRPVAVQPAATGTVGFITAGNNVVQVYDENGVKLASVVGDEVYGRLVEADDVYSVDFFTIVDGVETAYTFATPTAVRLSTPYRFAFSDLPSDAIVGTETRFVSNDPSVGSPEFQEALTVTATNTLSLVARNVRTDRPITLNVNTVSIPSTTGAFTVSGRTVTWVAATAGYSLDTTDSVTITYFG